MKKTTFNRTVRIHLIRERHRLVYFVHVQDGRGRYLYQNILLPVDEYAGVHDVLDTVLDAGLEGATAAAPRLQVDLTHGLGPGLPNGDIWRHF